MFSKLNYTFVCIFLMILCAIILIALCIVSPFVLTFEIFTSLINFFQKIAKKS